MDVSLSLFSFVYLPMLFKNGLIHPGVNPQGEIRKRCGHEVPCGEAGEEKLRRDLWRGAVGLITKNNV